MAKEITVKTSKVPQEVQSSGGATSAEMLKIISNAAANKDVDVEKMERLLAMQERLMAKQAEIAFNRDLATVQEQLPTIKKSGKIKVNGEVRSTYAKYEDIDDAIRPILISYGFTLSFDSPENNGKINISGTLSHKEGHSRTVTIPLTIDTSGSKNNVQGVGSTIAYGKRYLVGMLLNLVFKGEDDDGQSGGSTPISEEQVTELNYQIQAAGVDQVRFLQFLGVKTVEEVKTSDYKKAINALEQKRAQIGAKL